MQGYFSNFKNYQYNGAFCKNIVSRAAMVQSILKISSVTHPYVTESGERPDTLAFYYYEDPEDEWMLFFANQVIDPYYQWYLPQDVFDGVVTDKYGSIARAQTKIKHFETNWIQDDRKLTVAAYTALPASHKKYWSPIVDEYDNAASYVRKREVVVANTNKIIKLSVSNVIGSFASDEDVYQIVNNTITAAGTISMQDQNAIHLKHVRGTFDPAYPIYGADGEATADLLSVVVVATPIPNDETIYWTSVSYYDYEMQINESNKVIKIMDTTYAETARTNLASVMR